MWCGGITHQTITPFTVMGVGKVCLRHVDEEEGDEGRVEQRSVPLLHYASSITLCQPSFP